MKNFILIGAAGYIAPRHMKAIKETENNLIAAYDPYDGIGVIDSYFPKASFFTEFERFDRHIEKLKRSGLNIDYVSICSPNYLHDSHIRYGLRIGADVICEKPIVLNPWNIDALIELESDYPNKVNTILQLRHHPSILKLKNMVDIGDKNKTYDIDLTYITSRGKWYHASWKGNLDKSGGIATNIGIHFFDILQWIFGSMISFYHVGIEQGFFTESFVCDLGSSNGDISKEDLLKQLQNKTPISCKDVTFKFLGLSLATINTVISILLSGIMIQVIKNYGKN